MTRRLDVTAAIVFVVALAATACSSSSSSSSTTTGGSAGSPTPAASQISGTLRLFSYGDGFEDDYIQSFRDEYPNVNLETAPFGSNDEAEAKLQAGFQADVVNSCVDESTLDMVKKGLYQPIDTSRIPAWSKIFPAIQPLPAVQVDGRV